MYKYQTNKVILDLLIFIENRYKYLYLSKKDINIFTEYTFVRVW